MMPRIRVVLVPVTLFPPAISPGELATTERADLQVRVAESNGKRIACHLRDPLCSRLVRLRGPAGPAVAPAAGCSRTRSLRDTGHTVGGGREAELSVVVIARPGAALQQHAVAVAENAEHSSRKAAPFSRHHCTVPTRHPRSALKVVVPSPGARIARRTVLRPPRPLQWVSGTAIYRAFVLNSSWACRKVGMRKEPGCDRETAGIVREN
jgi:hypothetical protein